MQNQVFFRFKPNSLNIRTKKFVLISLFLTILYLPFSAQSPKELFKLSREAQNNGYFIKSEKYLLSILKQKENIEQENLVAVYNQLGIINKSLGRYDKAVNYYLLGENISINNIETLRYKLPSIYNNLGNIYKYKGDYEKALVYFQESISNLNLQTLKKEEKEIFLKSVFNNIGIVYSLNKDYYSALIYFKKSIDIINKNKFDNPDEVFNNYANCMRETNNNEQAEIYYQKCINQYVNKYSNNYYKLAYVYKSYGKFKIKTSELNIGLELYNKALKIYLSNFGEKHPYTADMYEIFGDYYFKQNKLEDALLYYQKSLIANSPNFQNTDVNKNPDIKTVFSELQLLRSLKKKSETLLSMSQNINNKIDKVKKLNLSLEILEQAINLIQIVRQGYISLESKLYITGNEKELYITAIENAIQLYEQTDDNQYIEKAYLFSGKSKAIVLLNEIKQNETLMHILPDSLKENKTELLQNIASFKKLIFDENEKIHADKSKISLWQLELFNLNKKYETILNQISKNYPPYSNLMAKTKIIQLSEIQNSLSENETLIEYNYLKNKKKGQLYTFVVNNKELKYFRISIDSTFEQNLDFYKEKMKKPNARALNVLEYNELNTRLYSLYRILIEPLKLDVGKKIIIIPDEKIANLSFDALISKYKNEQFINYTGIAYLLYDFQFSYLYSSSLIYNKNNHRSKKNYVYAFAPNYQETDKYSNLENTKKEIKSILNYFKGEVYIGESATKTKFKSISGKNGIFHLALHANLEKVNSDYSYLAFSQTNIEKDKNLMYSYEISSYQINASMVVLSACSTGDGKIFSGEGVMSLSRGFILAGASSVIHTLWEINDETSAVIIDCFYKFLSEGKSKSEALQLAKIKYIENSSPEMSNPVYWSGIVLLGNQNPLVNNNNKLIISVSILLLLLISALLFYRRHKKD
ncbi:MAG: CHAT domain-containing protein [Bacteroidales bacterium]|nr:CHAT domain-containing protein [Bacteroidales bacterium]MBN2757021.1 CHAT domain-containing protein [Bacteroidales bacterium]